MAASTLRPPHAADVPETTPDAPVERPQRGRQIMRTAAIVVAAMCSIAFLFPVIAAPVNADDRYWYLMIGHRAEGSALEVLRWSWSQISVEVLDGRLASFGAFQRRLVGMFVIEAAVATSTPIVVYQALVKLVLFGGGVLSALSFVRSLRWRDRGGELVRVGRPTLLLVGVAGTLAVAVGAQAHSQFRNGWTSYPVFTYGAVIFIFGSVALLLWITRLVAGGSRVATIVGIAGLLLLAAATNLSYELVYPAVPVAAVALAIIPVTDRARRSAGRRAKLLTGSTYLGGFAVFFVAIRLYLADICARTECYEGVAMQLQPAAARTALYNLLTAVPGSGGTELLADLDSVGWAERYPVPPSGWSIAVGIGAAVALLTAWWVTHVDRPAADVTDAPVHPASRRAEATMLGIGAGLSLLVALGTATVMGLSEQAQQLITEPGTAYRNTMVTWTALALALVLVVCAVSILLTRRGELVAWASLAVLIGTVGMLTLQGNMMALRANRINLAVTEAISWEVVKGDTTVGSDARRCDLYEQLEDASVAERARQVIYREANAAFGHYHGQAFCSDPNYPGGGR
jgi:hypothetical protein